MRHVTAWLCRPLALLPGAPPRQQLSVYGRRRRRPYPRAWRHRHPSARLPWLSLARSHLPTGRSHLRVLRTARTHSVVASAAVAAVASAASRGYRRAVSNGLSACGPLQSRSSESEPGLPPWRRHRRSASRWRPLRCRRCSQPRCSQPRCCPCRYSQRHRIPTRQRCPVRRHARRRRRRHQRRGSPSPRPPHPWGPAQTGACLCQDAEEVPVLCQLLGGRWLGGRWRTSRHPRYRRWP